ncbi:cardiolipin synthase [Lacticaseibacillus pabuli]|uniref:Cardiolipin synthase n=1 Tax=Lacticaseibacillus pabuli TaxID=3025672 RepID=A0ABY7WRZ9_9LACO|nr:cardiolipin synthase [Lacticaseibacillus sp. KACC 23028]WDF82967.1 cardiolipin synthase [Lacticaseibacillus sp. KACC 23028]
MLQLALNNINHIIQLIVVINAFFAVIVVFHRQRNIAATWAWLLVLVLLPAVGFILYMFTGRGMSHDKLFEMGKADRIGIKEMIDEQRKSLPHLEHTAVDAITKDRQQTVELFRRLDRAPLIRRNDVTIITDGEEKFKMLLGDIAKAQHSIHIEYYTIYPDNIGTKLRDALTERAKAGVEVRVVYDAFGSHGISKKFWRTLTNAGGEAIPFITSTNVIARFRLNYHDHRKIVVIDGKIGYTGGFNVGDQYLGRSKKFGYWRDTHLKIIGHGVQLLQARFMMDWNASTPKPQKLAWSPVYFPAPDEAESGSTSMQVVTSGPDSDTEQIKLGYIKLISDARKRVWIQSPYLVPDDSMLTALRMAAQSGVDVRIMIPHMPDHPFIYRATQYYAHLLHDYGVKIYVYQNGFIHAKTMLVDDDLSSVGSANQDFRSYGLNFEVNTFMYDSKVTEELAKIYTEDMDNSLLLDNETIKSWSLWLRFKQRFSRLLSPVL